MTIGQDYDLARRASVVGRLLGIAALGLLSISCGATAHAFRLNPEVEPEQYRVTCKKRFYFCEKEARAQCEGEYQELSRFSNQPEQTLVKDSDLSSTGPAKGQANWEGELTVECGRLLPPLRLNRPTEPGAAPVASTEPFAPGAPKAAPSEPPPASAERVCVPGVTQACLGPGACNGAQACLESGQGFGPCDCGTPAGAATSPSSTVPVTPVSTAPVSTSP